MSSDSTSVTIAHRLGTISNCDSIVVLNAGRITERGRHANYWRSEGEYKAMWDAQARNSEAEEVKEEAVRGRAPVSSMRSYFLVYFLVPSPRRFEHLFVIHAFTPPFKNALCNRPEHTHRFNNHRGRRRASASTTRAAVFARVLRPLPAEFPARHAPGKQFVVRVPVVVRVVTEPQGRRRVLEAQLFVVRPLRLQLAVVLLVVDGRRGRRVVLLVARLPLPRERVGLAVLELYFFVPARAPLFEEGRVGLARDALAGRAHAVREAFEGPLSWPPWGNFWMGGRAWRGRGGSRGGGSRARGGDATKRPAPVGAGGARGCRSCAANAAAVRRAGCVYVRFHWPLVAQARTRRFRPSPPGSRPRPAAAAPARSRAAVAPAAGAAARSGAATRSRHVDARRGLRIVSSRSSTAAPPPPPRRRLLVGGPRRGRREALLLERVGVADRARQRGQLLAPGEGAGVGRLRPWLCFMRASMTSWRPILSPPALLL